MLEVRGLHSGYGRVPVLRDVELQIKPGEILLVLGPNGAGKSTLLRTIAGFIAPSAGEIIFEGRSIAGESPESLVKRGLRLVLDGHRVFPELTVADNIRLGARSKRDASQLTDQVLDIFPILREKYQAPARDLSGGQQQMLAISRALLSRPKLMLMDEPSLGLSPRLTQEIFAIIGRINREQGTTILLVEQNANMALEVAEFGYVLEVGRIVMEDTCKRLAQKEDVQEFYLGMKAQGVRGQRRWKKKKQWR